VLDIGDGRGALILYAPAELLDREIEVTPAGAPDAHRTHAQVRERHVAGTVSYAAVYPELSEGDYIIWRDRQTPAATVTITGGQVTRHHWPS
jgi:hypothetical protein